LISSEILNESTSSWRLLHEYNQMRCRLRDNFTLEIFELTGHYNLGLVSREIPKILTARQHRTEADFPHSQFYSILPSRSASAVTPVGDSIVTIPEGVTTAICGAFFGSLLASGLVNWLTQNLIEGRELRAKRDTLRLELYLEIVDRVVRNEGRRANWRNGPADDESSESCQQWLGLRHRLVLLGSQKALDAYKDYEDRLWKKLCNEGRTPDGIEDRIPDGIDQSRDVLIQIMQTDIGTTSTNISIVTMMPNWLKRSVE